MDKDLEAKERMERQIASAISYNRRAEGTIWKREDLPRQFRILAESRALGNEPERALAMSVFVFQTGHGLVADGKLGTRTLAEMQLGLNKPVLLSPGERSKLVEYTVRFEGGKDNPYASINLDAEYEGHFDAPRTKGGKRLDPKLRHKEPDFKPHPASKYHPSGGYHVGLSFGAWQAAQEPGSLGSLLLLMSEADPALFKEIFGPSWDELLVMTTSTNRRVGKYSPRTYPVDGAHLWEEPWVSRFLRAGAVVSFQEVQRQWVGKMYFDRCLPVAEEHNLDSAGALAVLFDIAIQFGVGGMKSYVQKSGLVSGAAFDPEAIKRVIRALPKARRARRNSILELAGQDVRYTW